MSKKVKIAVFDKDLKARIVGKFELTTNGEQIKIKTGGKANFKPYFDNESFLEFPKKIWEFWKPEWSRMYFVRKGAKTCVNFKTETVEGPDPELVMEAAGNEILRNIGKDKKETTLVAYLTLGALVLLIMKVFGMI